MKEPFTVRLSDDQDPERGEKFDAVLKKRGAYASEVLRKLVDAYIKADGGKAFPVRLVEECEEEDTRHHRRGHEGLTQRYAKRLVIGENPAWA